MDLHNITLISFAYFDESFLRKAAGMVRSETGLRVEVREEHIDLSDYFDPSRRQYNADRLLKTIDSHYATGSYKTVGIFSVDLFIPILTYIFGQAYLNGRSGIVSSFRLSNEGYGLPHEENAMQERLTKEIIHELGHMVGLIHCHFPNCVMRGGTYVEDIDLKGASFCNECRKKIRI